MSFIETEEQKELRASVSKLGERFNYVDYVLPRRERGSRSPNCGTRRANSDSWRQPA